MPRKFKIAFESSPTDSMLTAIHDIGAVACLKDGKRGFKLYVGGGLGATPHLAILLEDFTPEEMMLPTFEALIRLFDRHGNRQDKSHARMKFVVKQWGADAFRQAVLSERAQVYSTSSGAKDWSIPPLPAEEAPETDSSMGDVPSSPAFLRWKATNVYGQKQNGYSWVEVVLPLGDITVKQMRALAGISRRFNGGRMATTITQNIILRWVKNSHLPALHAELVKADLAVAGANRFSDVTRCPGADTCQIAVTKSRELAIAVGGLFSNGLTMDADMEGVHVKISGCTNSCGQHHIGTIGFYGTYRKIDGREVPHYQLLIGGSAAEGKATFGVPVVAIPARRVPDALKAIVAAYKAEKQNNEDMEKYLQRVGRKRIKEVVEPHITLPPFDTDPTQYYDWGDASAFKAEIGQGECAA